MRKALTCMSFLAAGALSGSAARAGDALLVVMDRSASMSEANKWTFGSQGIMDALDQAGFDAFEVGLVSAPSGEVTGPACVLNLPISCQSPSLPQVPIGPAGAKSFLGPGKRQDILDWLEANSPDIGLSGSFPMYEVVQAGLSFLRVWGGTGHRILVVVTDGGIGCAVVAVPARPGYLDCNGCNDWEYPQSLVTLVAQANADVPSIDTFVIGAPGADSTQASGCDYPPYHMRLALSAIAAAGAPEHVSPTCTGRTFTQAGGDPTVACHADLTMGNFTAATVANAVVRSRDQVLDLIFEDGFDDSTLALISVTNSYSVRTE
jgi:hypothetical protein